MENFCQKYKFSLERAPIVLLDFDNLDLKMLTKK